MSLQDGIVTGSPDLGDTARVYLTIPHTTTSAYYASLYTMYQNAVDTSDRIHRQRATLSNTTDVMHAVDGGLESIGSKFDSHSSVDDKTKVITVSYTWSAESDTAAFDVSYALALSGQAPPAVELALDADSELVRPDTTNITAAFWYDANQGSDQPAKWVQAFADPEDLEIGYDPLHVNEENSPITFWKYKLNGVSYEIRPFNPEAVQPTAIDDDADLESLLPGMLVVKTRPSGLKEYYLVSTGHTLVAVPDPNASTFFPCIAKTDLSTVQDWKRTLKAGHDEIANVSQTQSEYLSSLSSSLQNYLSSLTNLLQRLERTLSSLIDRT